MTAAQKRWYRDNPDRVRSIQATYREKNAEKVLDRRLRYRYGITLNEARSRLQSQGGKCAICPRPISVEPKTEHRRRAVVDHDHATGKVRGLLCHDCNKGLGSFRDDVFALSRAVHYVKTAQIGAA